MQACMHAGVIKEDRKIEADMVWVQNTLQLSWKATTRLVIHFCDAPGHSTAYHDGCLDYFPAGDPAGRLSLLRF